MLTAEVLLGPAEVQQWSTAVIERTMQEPMGESL
jgi:hypothetical protein